MKKTLILLLLFLTANILSQDLFNSYEKGIIYLRNDTKLEGYIKKTKFDQIKYKKDLKAEKQVFGYKTVKKIKFLYGDEYHYKKSKKTNKTLLIKRDIKGKLDLFSFEVSNNFPGGMGTGMGSGVNLTIGISSSRNVYYIGKPDSDFIELLPKNT